MGVAMQWSWQCNGCGNAVEMVLKLVLQFSGGGDAAGVAMQLRWNGCGNATGVALQMVCPCNWRGNAVVVAMQWV